MPVGREAGRPSLLCKWLGLQKLSGLSIETIKKTVPIGLKQGRLGGAVPRNVREDQLLGGIPIVVVSGRELVVPPQLSCASINRDHGGGIQAPRRTTHRVIHGGWVSCTPIDETERGIVRARGPRRSSPVFPGVSNPSLIAWFSGARNSVKPPSHRAVFRLVCRNQTSYSEVTSTDSHDN